MNRVVGRMIGFTIQDVDVNRSPLQQDYSQTEIPAVMTPKFSQDTSQADLTKGPGPIYGVGAPGSLEERLMVSMYGPRSEP